MQILEYIYLNTQGVEKSYQKIKTMIANDDFYSAQIKKLHPTEYYRAKLDDANRVLFKIVSYQGQTVALILEIIHQHAYAKSRFLRGAVVDETKILENLTASSLSPTETLTYINPQKPYFHVLDKIIAFDDLQQDIYQLPLPLVLIGSAGSGKTALTLEKMKSYSGDILYVTHSPYLVQHARQLYYAHEIVNEHARVDFLSYRELLETIQVPPHREIQFCDFSAWLGRFDRQAKVLRDHHKLLEEFKGVITGSAVDRAFLSRADYLALGVKQSIYSLEDRTVVYDTFEKYLDFLKREPLDDLNLLSYRYLPRCQPRYDIVVVDEIQDFTNIQLLLVMKCLKNPAHFLFCGDANQIVHPNFFSWAKIKTLFYQGVLDDQEKTTRILVTNYRNSSAVTEMANRILKIKNARLGSVDKESHYLIQSQNTQPGTISFIQSDHSLVQKLNQKTRHSTHYAVIVIREEYKAAARRYFQTPLVFSIFETKGLEYDHIIIFDFISAESEAFRDIAQGITPEDLIEDLRYHRAKDKADKSLEIYKFYINALYVALTRAIRNIYWIESQQKHPLFDLLDLQALQHLSLEKAQSSAEDWQREARKLEQQGKQTQADAIRQSLHNQSVPWTVITPAVAAELRQQILAGGATKAAKIQCLEYALIYGQSEWVELLARQGLSAAQSLKKSGEIIQQKYYDLYRSSNLSAALQSVNRYGVDFRNPFNQTLLMIAAQVGNGALARKLLETGANADLTDNQGQQAFDLVWRQTATDPRYTQTKLPELYSLLAPGHLSLQAENRLIKIDQKNMEFLLVYATQLLLRQQPLIRQRGFTTQDLVALFQDFPESVLSAYRKKRAYLSSLLSKNELHGPSPYNRRLFRRIRQGHYILNPGLRIKTSDGWAAVNAAESSLALSANHLPQPALMIEE